MPASPEPVITKAHVPNHKLVVGKEPEAYASLQVTEQQPGDRMTAAVVVSFADLKGTWQAELLAGELRLFALNVDQVRRNQAGGTRLSLVPGVLSFIVYFDKKEPKLFFAVDYIRRFGFHNVITLPLNPADLSVLIDSLQTADPGEITEERVREIHERAAARSTPRPAGPRRDTAARAGFAGAWFLALAFALPLAAAGDTAISGDWAGAPNLPQQTLRFVLHIEGSANALSATVDIPDDHNVSGGKVDSIALSGSTLSFAIPYLDVKFSGDVNSNGTIVGTLVRHGTGVPLILTRTIAPLVAPRILNRPPLPVTGGVFHHDRSGIDLTLPAGWSVARMETATTDSGEMAVLTDPDHKAVWASVYMRSTETHPAEIPKLLDDSLTRKIASRAGETGGLLEAVIKGYKIRPGSVEHTVVNGQQAIRAIGEYTQAGEPVTEFLVWVYTEHAMAYFDLRGQASLMELLQPVFEQMIQSAGIP